MGFAARPTCLHSTLTTFPIYCCLGIISEQGGLPTFTALLFPPRSTGLWLDSLLFVWRVWDPKEQHWQLVVLIEAFTLCSPSLPAVLPPRLLKARGSLCHTWSGEIGDYGLLPGNSWELLLGLFPGLSFISCSCHSFLEELGFAARPECPTSKGLR